MAATAASALMLPVAGLGAETPPVSQQRGYYLCFMRMPTFGLAVWKEILDDAAADGANTIILWLVGRRQIPFGFGWLKDGENPYRELPVRAIRPRTFWPQLAGRTSG